MENLNSEPTSADINYQKIQELSDNPEEAAAIMEITERIKKVPGKDQMFDYEINKLGINPEDSLKQDIAEDNFGAIAGDEKAV